MALDVESMLVDEDKEVQEHLKRQEEHKRMIEMSRQQRHSEQSKSNVDLNAIKNIFSKILIRDTVTQNDIVTQFRKYDRSIRWARRITIIILLLKLTFVYFNLYNVYMYLHWEEASLLGVIEYYKSGFPEFLNSFVGALIPALIVRIVIHALQWLNRHKMKRLVPAYVYWIVYILHIFIV